MRNGQPRKILISLRISIIAGALLAGMSECLSLEKMWWIIGLIIVAGASIGEIVYDIIRRHPSKRVSQLLRRIIEFVLHDQGTYTLTIYRRTKGDGLYRPVYRYSRDPGFHIFPKSESKPAFPPHDIRTTLGAALCAIGNFIAVEDLPQFIDRQEMMDYHINHRHIPADIVAQFSDRSIHLRSIGSLAISHWNTLDVMGVLTIDCTVPNAFGRLSDDLHPIDNQLAYWVEQLAEVLP